MKVQLTLIRRKDVTIEKVDRIFHHKTQVFISKTDNTTETFKVKNIISYVAEKEQEDEKAYADVHGKNGTQKYTNVPRIAYKDKVFNVTVDDHINDRQWNAVYQADEVYYVDVLVDKTEEIRTYTNKECWETCQDLINQGYLMVADCQFSKWLSKDGKMVVVVLSTGGK